MLIPTPKNTRNITDFRNNPNSVLEAVQGGSGPLYLLRGSTPKAVVLDIEEYIRLREYLEDYEDSLLALEIEKNPEKGGITLKDFLEKYQIKKEKVKAKKNVQTNH